jgi:hypothetical protein
MQLRHPKSAQQQQIYRPLKIEVVFGNWLVLPTSAINANVEIVEIDYFT